MSIDSFGAVPVIYGFPLPEQEEMVVLWLPFFEVLLSEIKTEEY